MADVSLRLFGWFESAHAAGLIDLEGVLAEAGLTAAILSEPSGRLPWSTWTRMTEAAARQLGTREAIIASGAVFPSPRLTGGIARVASLVVEPRDAIHVGVGYLAAQLLRGLQFEVNDRSDGRVQVDIRIPDAEPACEPWLLMVIGALRALPAVLGFAEAEVEASVTPRHGRYLVRCPQSRGLLARIRRVLRWVRHARPIADDVLLQQRELAEVYQTARRSERDLFAVLAGLPALVVLHRDGRVVFANAVAVDALAAGADLAGRDLRDVVHADDRAAFDAFLGADPAPDDVRVRLTGVAGAVHVALTAFGPVSFDGVSVAGLHAMDVTDRVQVTRQLASSQDILATVADALPDLLVRLGPGGAIRDVSGAAGTRQREAFVAGRGQDVAAALAQLSAAGAPAARARIEASLTGMVAGAVELEGPSAGFELRVVPLPATGEALLIVRDVTALRAAEREQAIADRMASLGTLVASLAHYINNPLAWVRSNLELLRDDAATPEGHQPALTDAIEGVERIGTLVRGLYGFSRVSEPATVTFPVSEAVAQVLRIAGTEVLHRSAIVVDVEDGLLASGDRPRVEQVLVNLVVNAVQAMPADRPAEENHVAVRGVARGDRVVLTVVDDAGGMDPDTVRHAFDPFFTTKQNARGLGLGLPIAWRAAREAGGTLTLDSVPGEGTTFTLTLPRGSVHDLAPVPRARPPTPTRPARVLVIDDEPALARAMERMLTAYETHVVHDVDAAIALLRELGRVDVVLCDMMMPGADGVDFFDRALAVDPSLVDRVIYVSGGMFTERATRFVTRVNPRVLSKPFTVAELREVVAQAAWRARS